MNRSYPYNHDISMGDISSVPPEDTATGVRRLSSKNLFGGAREVIIEHAGVEYRLRLTSQDKLILTK